MNGRGCIFCSVGKVILCRLIIGFVTRYILEQGFVKNAEMNTGDGRAGIRVG